MDKRSKLPPLHQTNHLSNPPSPLQPETASDEDDDDDLYDGVPLQSLSSANGCRLGNHRRNGAKSYCRLRDCEEEDTDEKIEGIVGVAGNVEMIGILGDSTDEETGMVEKVGDKRQRDVPPPRDMERDLTRFSWNERVSPRDLKRSSVIDRDSYTRRLNEPVSLRDITRSSGDTDRDSQRQYSATSRLTREQQDLQRDSTKSPLNGRSNLRTQVQVPNSNLGGSLVQRHEGYRPHNASVDKLIIGDSKVTMHFDKLHVFPGNTGHLHGDIMPIAPPLDDHTSHHVIFLSHPSNQAWVSDVTSRLEAPFLGFRCWYKDRPIATVANGHHQHSNHHSNQVKGYHKAVIVISQEFVTDIWNNDDVSLHSISKTEPDMLNRVGIVVLLDDSDVPVSLRGVTCIDTRLAGWWTRLICQLCSFESSIQSTNDTKLSISTSFIKTPSVATSNGYLLHSIKSRCVLCGQEFIDVSECPKEFHKHGIKVPVEEYRCALEHLFADSRFQCHVCCYHLPLSMCCFTILLCACLLLIPFAESRFSFQVDESGLQYVHAVLVWLFFLTFYLVVLHISRRKMKVSTYARLVTVNRKLSRYKVLACIENLGLADCNKYYLHFFYFDLGPCLTYLQELLAALHDTASLATDVHDGCHGDMSLTIDCDTQLNGDLNHLDATITNGTIQNRAATLIFQKSGEYLSNLITKKLDSPINVRHMSNYPCPCQYVEHSAFKMRT